ncbi:MAG: hypothetical protein IPP56_13795 [Bacteroidetes bacterium]|nr:hypothetical protein [Bacteroidota bacterium]MBK9800733.1 hypothetical protein [Bacteroidota bacterium]
MQTALIILSAFATILTGYVDSINEAREIWLKNRIPNEVANKYKEKFKKHSLWAVHRIVIFFATSIPIFYVEMSWFSLCVAAANFVAQMALFRFLHDSFLQVQFGNKFTSDSDGLSDSKIDALIDDKWSNRVFFLIVGLVIEVACLIGVSVI